jgi:translation initiation factor 2 beta subunit (eIF-2beta)/eIF-5
MGKCKSSDSSAWYGTKLILPFYILREMKKYGQTFKELDEFIDNYLKVRCTFCGSVSNENVYMEYEDNIFPIMICGGYLDLWSKDDETLGHVKTTKDDIPDDKFINKVKEILDNYINGYVHCSDCGKLIKKEDIAGRYFSSSFCSDCWNRKWKDIESNETYE